MKSLEVISHELKTKPHCILPYYARALNNRIERYMAQPDMPMDMTDPYDMPMSSSVDNGVATISINGVIMKRLGLPQTILDLFGIVDLDNIDAQLIAARDNPAVTSILLDVNSPGGFVTGVVSTSNLISQVSKAKETVVFSDVLNASAAYWLSSGVPIIGTVDGTFGSIGVYADYESYTQALTNAGIQVTLVKAGKWKALGDPTQPFTDEQKAFVQEDINSIWADFKAAVNRNRNVADENMQGQTFSGTEAYDLGLIDGLANNINEVKAILSAGNN